MNEDLDVPSPGRRLLARVMTTLAAWSVAFLIVLALLTAFGRQMESLPPALDALVFTGVLVPFMGNVVMPALGGIITRWVIGPRQTRAPREVSPGTRSADESHRRTLLGAWGASRTAHPFELRPIGWVESSLVDREVAPKQGDEGSPEAWLVFDPVVREGLRNLQSGTDIIVLTWLNRARRDVLRAHPRHLANPEQEVFSTHSPDRPNPIGLHRVHLVPIEGSKALVLNLEALHGTPIPDVKPVRDGGLER